MPERGYSIFLRLTGIIVLVFSLTQCAGDNQPVHKRTLLAFGTLIEVNIWGVDKQTAEDAFQILTEDFDIMHQTWHAWRPGTLMRVNRMLASEEWFTGSMAVTPLIQLAGELSASSQKLFNPAIGQLIGLWGFHADELPSAPPAAATIAELIAANPNISDIEINGLEMRSTNAAVQLDFGGFAKGYGIDLAIERLRSLGINNAIVNAGGDLRAIGQPGKRPWRVGIRHPRANSILASLEISGDQSVFSSGDYERYFEYQGTRYHHIIDPRTGYPATGTQSVTVIADNATLADAAATALFVAGPDEWRTVAQSLGINRVLLVDSDGQIHMTPQMKAAITLTTP